MVGMSLSAILLPIRGLFHYDIGLSPKKHLCLALISNIPGFLKLGWNAFLSCVECVVDLSSSKIIFVFMGVHLNIVHHMHAVP